LEVRVVAEDRERRIRDLIAGLFLGIAGNLWVEYAVKFLEVFEMGELDYLVASIGGLVVLLVGSWLWIRRVR
jgi:hypothetical protein